MCGGQSPRGGVVDMDLQYTALAGTASNPCRWITLSDHAVIEGCMGWACVHGVWCVDINLVYM